MSNSGLRVGVAVVDITPPMGTQVAGNIGVKRPCNEVIDPIKVRALVLESQGLRLCLLSSDVLGIRHDYVDDLRTRAQERFGLSPEHVMVHTVQNHAAPAVGHLFCLDEGIWRKWIDSPDLEWVLGGDPAYNELFVERNLQAIDEALQVLQPVSMVAGRATEGSIAFNRRGVMRDGSAMMHPAAGDPNLSHIEGPMDPEVSVVAFRNEAGEDVTSLLHFSSHPQPVVHDKAIANAWTGAWCDAMGSVLSSGAVAIPVNGCCGNLHPRNPYTGEQMDYKLMGKLLSQHADRILKDGHASDGELVLACRSEKVQIPLRQLDTRMIEAARATMDANPTPMWKDDQETEIDWKWIYAISHLDLAAHSEKYDCFEYEIQAFRIGDVALLALIGEPFVEGQLKIKLNSPAEYTQIAHMSNGYVGYIPTAEAIERGGFEATTCHWSKLEPQALEQIVDVSGRMLQDLFAD